MEDEAAYVPAYSDWAVYFESEGAVTSRDECHLSSTPQFQIKFNFSYRVGESTWIIDQDSREPRRLSESESTPMEKSILINPDHYQCRGEAHERISRELQDWPLSSELRRDLIDSALDDVARGVKSMPQTHNLVRVRLYVDVVYEHYFAQRSALHWVVQQWMEEEGAPRMVPAADSAIQALESKEISSLTETGSCCICLDDICGAVVCMPCSHVFHGDCITKWLKTSRYCPVCRFEMPID